MQRLVISYWYGDCQGMEVIVPIWYDSPEAFLVDLEEWFNAVVNRTATSPFMVNGEEFDWSDFSMYAYDCDNHTIEFNPPNIETLEEWFETTARKPT